MPASTLLTLTAIGLPPYSARGLSQTISPIREAAQLRRTVNGELDDVSDVLFRKYESTISGDDVDPPAMDMVWPGMQLVVGCIQELSVQYSETDPIAEEDLGRPAAAWPARIEGGFLFYRPVLTMRVVDWSADSDEWEHMTKWSLQLEEV